MSKLTEPQKMRLIAGFLEAHPELPTIVASRAIYTWPKDDAIIAAKLSGAKKEYDKYNLIIRVPVVVGLDLLYYIPREQVCTPKKVVNEWVEPREGRWDQKVVAWDCHPLLAPTPEGEAIEAIVKEATPIDSDIPF